MRKNNENSRQNIACTISCHVCFNGTHIQQGFIVQPNQYDNGHKKDREHQEHERNPQRVCWGDSDVGRDAN